MKSNLAYTLTRHSTQTREGGRGVNTAKHGTAWAEVEAKRKALTSHRHTTHHTPHITHHVHVHVHVSHTTHHAKNHNTKVVHNSQYIKPSVSRVKSTYVLYTATSAKSTRRFSARTVSTYLSQPLCVPALHRWLMFLTKRGHERPILHRQVAVRAAQVVPSASVKSRNARERMNEDSKSNGGQGGHAGARCSRLERMHLRHPLYEAISGRAADEGPAHCREEEGREEALDKAVGDARQVKVDERACPNAVGVSAARTTPFRRAGARKGGMTEGAGATRGNHAPSQRRKVGREGWQRRRVGENQQPPAGAITPATIISQTRCRSRRGCRCAAGLVRHRRGLCHSGCAEKKRREEATRRLCSSPRCRQMRRRPATTAQRVLAARMTPSPWVEPVEAGPRLAALTIVKILLKAPPMRDDIVGHAANGASLPPAGVQLLAVAARSLGSASSVRAVALRLSAEVGVVIPKRPVRVPGAQVHPDDHVEGVELSKHGHESSGQHRPGLHEGERLALERQLSGAECGRARDGTGREREHRPQGLGLRV